jgi:hypothetical protein
MYPATVDMESGALLWLEKENKVFYMSHHNKWQQGTQQEIS